MALKRLPRCSIDGHCSRLFYRYGLLAYRIRYVLVAGPLLLTAALAPGLSLMRSQTITSVNYIFAPRHGRHIAERDEFRKRFGIFLPLE